MSFDLTKGHVPVLMAIALACFIAAASFTGGQWLSASQHVADQVRSLRVEMIELKNSVSSIEQIVSQMRYGQWTRGDQTLFCWEAERMNKNWQCPALKTNRADLQITPPELTNVENSTASSRADHQANRR